MLQDPMPVYLDCNATTPIDPEVRKTLLHYLDFEFGNPASRTHMYGVAANRAVQQARRDVSGAVEAQPEEVIFTSGATEANNLALLGLAHHLTNDNKTHIISTQIEHKSILEPLLHLQSHGFDVTLLPPTGSGWVDPDEVSRALRSNTGLISIMHANNETGVLQPLQDIATRLADTDAFFHTDAAQGFGKDFVPLTTPRIDMISISGHKIYGPKGVGALICRKRRFVPPPLAPLTHGGGQERRLRPGTLPVFLICALGTAAKTSLRDNQKRTEYCSSFRRELLENLTEFHPIVHGDSSCTLSTTACISIPGVDSEAAILALKSFVAISNGSACTSASYIPSHVLAAMGVSPAQISEALRWSWCHLSPSPNYRAIRDALHLLT